jgi:hypothetical protein
MAETAKKTHPSKKTQPKREQPGFFSQRERMPCNTLMPPIEFFM